MYCWSKTFIIHVKSSFLSNVCMHLADIDVLYRGLSIAVTTYVELSSLNFGLGPLESDGWEVPVTPSCEASYVAASIILNDDRLAYIITAMKSPR